MQLPHICRDWSPELCYYFTHYRRKYVNSQEAVKSSSTNGEPPYEMVQPFPPTGQGPSELEANPSEICYEIDKNEKNGLYAFIKCETYITHHLQMFGSKQIERIVSNSQLSKKCLEKSICKSQPSEHLISHSFALTVKILE